MSKINISAKERNLIKGAIRRVFSRSDLRREVLQESLVSHFDPERPRVKKWGKCSNCTTLTAAYQLEVDHIEPIIPLDKSLEEMSWDEVISRIFCDKKNLQTLCKVCHHLKSKAENKKRRENKKGKKQNGTST